MKNLIVSEIGEKRFSIQVDSTQDVGIVDQATVVARYVQDEAIKERLVAILPVKDATKKGFHELLMSCFDVLGLDFKKIAGESFDGAANMRSAYVGIRAQIAKKIRTDPKVLDGGALQRISKLAKVNECSLKTELISFANLFPSLTVCLSEDETQKVEIILDEEEINDWIPPIDKLVEVQKESKCGSCKQCFLCCHRLLLKYNLYSAAYENLSITYEYLLTLSFTQVSCERAFSKLKLIKTRLRATMGQELLDALMLMSVERDLLEQVQFPDVLEIIRQSFSLMRFLLTV
ncbi:zinc finger MYM-type 1-like [Pelobates cultripes]|uniref:Zinc finger MYM-type 1-like n=1 Tax=Pelobates cultripes TaxID=61616 RepID=A0AAD1RER8_PELCU|nr:zinc finger MYM-type 1-like [Pelobates cultripes]